MCNESSLIRTLVAGLVLFSASVMAQTSGTVAISGSVSPAYKITSGGASSLAGNSGGSFTSSALDAAVASVVDFGDVGPGNTNGAVCFTQPLMLRANASTSAVKAQVTASAGFGGGGAITLSDIGIGFTALAASGANADITNASIQGSYSGDPCVGTVGATGTPSFAATNSLGLLGAATTMISATSALSVRGSFTSANNAVRTTMRLAILPQAYAVNAGFSATLTLTIGAP